MQVQTAPRAQTIQTRTLWQAFWRVPAMKSSQRARVFNVNLVNLSLPPLALSCLPNLAFASPLSVDFSHHVSLLTTTRPNPRS